jgi:hypothetical protein
MPPLRIRYVHLLHERPDIAALRLAHFRLAVVQREIESHFFRRYPQADGIYPASTQRLLFAHRTEEIIRAEEKSSGCELP